MSLLSERRSGRSTVPMQVGAVLFLESAERALGDEAIAEIGRRFRGIRRLRQRLHGVPIGCGRPVWLDDPGFDVAHHVRATPCPAPGGEPGALRIAANLISTPLRSDRPLWAARLVTGVGPGTSALVVVFHHVLSDGIGGLAILQRIADGAPAAVPESAVPEGAMPQRRMPSRAALAGHALGDRLGALTGLISAPRRLAAAVSELRPTGRIRAAPTSLNRPTGPRRSFAVARADLAAVIDEAHAHGATVNDVLLTAVGAALNELLASRGERVDEFVVSVPFSARRRAEVDDLGNRSAVVPVRVPVTGEWAGRLGAVARATAAAKLAPRGATNAVLGPVFRLLARFGIYQRFIDRQRLIHTFVTNLRGPRARASMLGHPITGIAPLGLTTGNVTVSFAALSYAGTLAVTLAADSGACPDLGLLRDALERELAVSRPRASSDA